MTNKVKNVLVLIAAIPIGLGGGYGIQEIRLRRLRKKNAELKEECKLLEKEEAKARKDLKDAEKELRLWEEGVLTQMAISEES